MEEEVTTEIIDVNQVAIDNPDDNVIGTGISSLKKLSIAERREYVWDLYSRSVPIKEIARLLDVAPSTVSSDIKHVYTEYKDELASKSGAQLVAEHLKFLDDLEKAAFVQALDPDTEITLSSTGKVIKNVTGKVRSQDMTKFLELILKIRKEKINLQMSTQIIPQDVSQLSKTMKDATDTEKRKEIDARTEEEIKIDLEELLAKGRKL